LKIEIKKQKGNILREQFKKNRERSEFLPIETEKPNRKKIYPIQVFNKQRKIRIFTN